MRKGKKPTAAPHVDAPLAAIFEAMAAGAAAEPEPATLAERRAAADGTMLLIHGGPEDGVTSTDHEVPVEGGTVRVRVLRPDAHTAPSPTLFFIHGGGWFQGNLDTGEVECGPMASAADIAVVSVEYRLAPEHPFPTPLEDCVAAYRWTREHAADLGLDADRVAVGGTSAGGNLSAALLLACRDRGIPLPIAQVLEVPALDLTLGSPSMDEHTDGAGLTRAAVDDFAKHYVGTTPRTHPLVSPLLAEDLTGLPPAVVFVAEHDPVRDDGERWVRALQSAGVPAAGFRILNHVHGSWIIPVTITNRLHHDLRVATLRRIFDGTLVP